MQQNRPEHKLVSQGENGETMPFLINPVPCTQVVFEDINIKMNLDLIERWIGECKPNNERIIICSAGPSLEKYADRIREEQAKGTKVSCVKHSLPRLLELGITPDFCVVLDPRSVVGNSTHGHKRLNLYKNAPKELTFFVASVTDFRTTDFLVRNGHKVIGWHRWVDGMKNYPHLHPQLGGGSCSALGSIGLYSALGFRNMILVGFDSSYDSPAKTKLKTFKFGSRYEPNKKFIATGELGAQAQEFEELLLNNQRYITFDVWSEGLVGNIWKHMQRKYHLPEYKLYLL